LEVKIFILEVGAYGNCNEIVGGFSTNLRLKECRLKVLFDERKRKRFNKYKRIINTYNRTEPETSEPLN